MDMLLELARKSHMLLELAAPTLTLLNFLTGLIISPDLEANTQYLERRIRSLEKRKEDVEDELRSAACSGKKRKREVENWTSNVEYIMTEFGTLEQGVQQSSKFYVFRRKMLAKQLERINKEVMELVEQGDFGGDLFLDVGRSIVQLSSTPEPDGQAFQQNLDDICTSFKNGILSIGLYGMGGVGKTDLAKRAHDRLLKESTYSGHVYWVSVSQELDIHKLQSDTAKLLKLDITDENDEEKRATLLTQEFEKMTKFVFILDNVWNQIDAEKTGIPFATASCNLIVTSRSQVVCRGMGCQNIMKVNTLSEQEAFDLFLKTLECNNLSVEVEEICKKMANRCGGLPLALITLAGSMRGVTDIYRWRDELGGLQCSFLGQPDMENVVSQSLFYSYQRLRDQRLKKCVLHCSSYPKDSHISINQLIGNFISKELMESRLTHEAMVEQGHAILNQLVESCLLERISDDSLKMHDLIREMATLIVRDN